MVCLASLRNSHPCGLGETNGTGNKHIPNRSRTSPAIQGKSADSFKCVTLQICFRLTRRNALLRSCSIHQAKSSKAATSKFQASHELPQTQFRIDVPWL